MKKIFMLMISVCILSTITKAQNTFPQKGKVGIFTITPNASAALDIDTTGLGLLIPRMTKAQRDSIVSPSTALLIYQTNNTPGFYYYDGNKWAAISKGASTSLNNLAATSINKSLIADTDNVRDLGSASLSWRDIYFKGNIYNASGKIISLTGIDNTFVGVNTGTINTGVANSFFGKSAGQSNTSGAYNAYFGSQSGMANTVGSYNSFFGQNAGAANTTGFSNAFFGTFAGQSTTTGGSNSFFGQNAGYSNTTAVDNSFFGRSSGFSNTTGYANAFFGKDAGKSNTTGYSNSFFGKNAGYSNINGHSNVFSGENAGYFNTTGIDNVFLGDSAGYSNTTGSQNVFLGKGAGYNNTYGGSNTFSGIQSGHENITGYDNAFYGFQAGAVNTTGNGNFFGGPFAALANTSGSDNTCLGNSAGGGLKTGSDNVFVGLKSGLNVSGGIANSCFGTWSNISGASTSHATAIGYQALASQPNSVAIGNSQITSIGGYAGWTTFSDAKFSKQQKENVPGLAFINKLRPVTYHLDLTGIRKFYKQDTLEKNLNIDAKMQMDKAVNVKEAVINTGFIAQDVEKAAAEISYDFNGVDKPQNENSLYGLRYGEFVPPLVKAVQELSKKNDEKDEKIDALRKEIDELKAMIFNEGNSTSTVSNQQKISLSQSAKLEQNQPNPTTQSTIIKYFVPQKSTNAFIKINNINGQEIKLINLTAKGNGQINFQTNNIITGTYFYSLIIDGKIIDTKQMVINH